MTLSIVSQKRLDRHGIPVLAMPYEPETFDDCPCCNGSGWTWESIDDEEGFKEPCPLWGQIKHACEVKS